LRWCATRYASIVSSATSYDRLLSEDGSRAACFGAQHVTHQLYQVLPVTIGYYQRVGVVLLALVLTPYPSIVSSATSYDQACAALEERSTGLMSSPDSDQLMLAGLWFAQEPY